MGDDPEQSRHRAQITQNNLGNALRSLGERESGTARLEEAVAAYGNALAVFAPALADHYVGVTRQNLARAQAIIAKRQTEAAPWDVRGQG